MAKPKPGDLLTYMADIERTGVVLDRASNLVPTGDFWARRRGEMVESSKPAWWVHREDGTFDKVCIYRGTVTWLGRFTAGGARLDKMARSTETA